MQFEFVDLEETWVAGMPVRSPKRALNQLSDRSLEHAWSSILRHDFDGPMASVYTDFSNEVEGYNLQVVGYRCTSLDQVRRGHLVGRNPAGRYARFSSTGEFPQVLTNLWKQVDFATEQREIKRTFAGDLELYPNAYRIDFYVSVADDSGGPR